jgi:hypothetical protein
MIDTREIVDWSIDTVKRIILKEGGSIVTPEVPEK